VLSLLSSQEEEELDLLEEASVVRAHGIFFASSPIPDRQVPRSKKEFSSALERIDGSLSSGTNVLVHCRQGVGRSGMVAACLLVARGLSPGAAVDAISAARGVPVPESQEQRDWIDRFAAVTANEK
jgi:protein-tyrosine phosphatase